MCLKLVYWYDAHWVSITSKCSMSNKTDFYIFWKGLHIQNSSYISLSLISHSFLPSPLPSPVLRSNHLTSWNPKFRTMTVLCPYYYQGGAIFFSGWKKSAGRKPYRNWLCIPKQIDPVSNFKKNIFKNFLSIIMFQYI